MTSSVGVAGKPLVIEFFRGSDKDSGTYGVIGTQYSLPGIYLQGGIDKGDGIYVRQHGSVAYHVLPKGRWAGIQNNTPAVIALAFSEDIAHKIEGGNVKLSCPESEHSFLASLVARVLVRGEVIWENPNISAKAAKESD